MLILAVAATIVPILAISYRYAPRQETAGMPSSMERVSPADSQEVIQAIYQRFSLALPTAGDRVTKVDDDDMERIVRDLETCNPGMDNFQAFYIIYNGYVYLDLSGNKSLTDVSPLTPLPVRELRLLETGVTNLDCLTGMPIEVLGLNGTPVSDLSGLRNLPLKEISLWNCYELRDVSALTSCTSLVRLLAPPQSTNLLSLRHLSSLQNVTLNPDGWTQTSMDFWRTISAR
jgi:hypothetical protein